MVGRGANPHFPCPHFPSEICDQHTTCSNEGILLPRLNAGNKDALASEPTKKLIFFPLKNS